ncbi:MAG: HypC/HybG/HupF family hydrogenase formation chaperone [bacterium]|nr:HypC/HybG/HupF family hydrogenase formation chaperone [bacterium]
MCFTVPLRVIKKDGKWALLDDGRKVLLHMTPKVRIGGWVLAQANLAVATITKREALSIRKLIRITSKKITV